MLDHAVDAGLQVGRGWVAGQHGDLAFIIHHPCELTHDFFARFVVVHAVVRHASGIGSVGVEGDDDHTLVNRGFECAGEQVRVGAGDRDAISTRSDQLLDILRLDLRVFHRGGLPEDFDADAVEFIAQAFASSNGAVLRGEERRVGVALGNL